MPSFKTELKMKLNSMKDTVEKHWNIREQIEDRPELIEDEKKQRKKAKKEELKEKLTKRKREIKNFLEEHKLSESDIPEDEPKGTAKAQQYQDRARDRFADLEDPRTVVNHLEQEINDSSKPDGYKKAAFRQAKTRIDSMEAGDATKMQLSQLRRQLLPQEDRNRLQLSKCVEDIEQVVNFTANQLISGADYVYPDPSKKGNPTQPESQKELSEKLDNTFSPAKEYLEETIEAYKNREVG